MDSENNGMYQHLLPPGTHNETNILINLHSCLHFCLSTHRCENMRDAFLMKTENLLLPLLFHKLGAICKKTLIKITLELSGPFLNYPKQLSLPDKRPLYWIEVRGALGEVGRV